MGIYSAQVTVGQVRGPGFNPSVAHTRSVVNKATVGQAFLSKDCGFSLPTTNITVVPHTNLSLEAMKICSFVPILRGFVLPQSCATIHTAVWNISGIRNTQHPEMQSLKSFTPLLHSWSCIPSTGPSCVQRVNTTLCEIREEWWTGKYPITINAEFLLRRQWSVHQGIIAVSYHPYFETLLPQKHKHFLACFFSDNTAHCPFNGVFQHCSYNGVSWQMQAFHLINVLWSGKQKWDTHCTTRNKLMLHYVLSIDEQCLLGCDTMQFHRVTVLKNITVPYSR